MLGRAAREGGVPPIAEAVVGDRDDIAGRPEQRSRPIGPRAGGLLDGSGSHRASGGGSRDDRHFVSGHGPPREGHPCAARAQLASSPGVASPPGGKPGYAPARPRAGDLLARTAPLAGERRLPALALRQSRRRGPRQEDPVLALADAWLRQ